MILLDEGMLVKIFIRIGNNSMVVVSLEVDMSSKSFCAYYMSSVANHVDSMFNFVCKGKSNINGIYFFKFIEKR